MKRVLGNASMDFRVLLEDVQKAIDEENPPLTSDELNEFTTRKGKRIARPRPPRRQLRIYFMELTSLRTAKYSYYSRFEPKSLHL